MSIKDWIVFRYYHMVLLFVISILAFSANNSRGQAEGWFTEKGKRVFPLGSYELPPADAELKKWVEAGFNLFACRSLDDLDRVHASGARCWVPLAMQNGATDALREKVNAMKDHPALAVWHGPDEFVWHLSASSRHRESGNLTGDDWWNLEERAVRYAEQKAQEQIPRLIEGIQQVRDIDDNDHLIWFNEARSSDVQYVRRFIEYIDIIGADDYPVKTRTNKDINRIGPGVDRWLKIGMRKPVWEVLQGFSWTELRDSETTDPVFPTFKESRFMAYSSITHGASGLLYWGSHRMQSDESELFQKSLFSLVHELDQLQGFLTGPEIRDVTVQNIYTIPTGESRNYAVEREMYTGISSTARRYGKDWIVILVNEEEDVKMGVEVSGLDPIDGEHMKLLYGSEEQEVSRGRIVTRMKPYEVKVFATRRKWESDLRDGRDYSN